MPFIKSDNLVSTKLMEGSLKIFTILGLFVLASCAQEQQKIIDGSVNEIKTYEPITVHYEENLRIEAICTALSGKQDVLDVLVNNGTVYNFDYAQRGCDDKGMSETKLVSTTIQASGENFIFKPRNGEAFGYINVETASKGLMAEICQGSTNRMNPMQTSSSGAIWFTVVNSANECQSDINGQCIYIQRGTVVEGTKYQIHTNEWVKFKTNGDKRGFFIERKTITSVGCSEGKTLARQAVLK